MSFDFLNGEILFINKPYKWTSFDVVSFIRKTLKYQLGIPKVKIGHAGTLDPLATGLLILCSGKFTKRIDEFQGLEKTYTGSFFLGATTSSFDLEKEVDFTYPTEHITHAMISDVAKSFIGNSEQIPPIFSAVKIDGKRAYKYARNDEDINISAKTINISQFDIEKIELPNIFFRIKCSKGTYIRAIARDFGIKLNSGAYLASLCRTQIGKYSLEDALTIEQFEYLIKNSKPEK